MKLEIYKACNNLLEVIWDENSKAVQEIIRDLVDEIVRNDLESKLKNNLQLRK